MSSIDNTANTRTTGSWAETYRDKWKWDKVTWGSHCIDCYPSNCPQHVFVKDGKVIRDEPGATFKTIEPGVPDMNPTGCQKGAAWSQMINGKDRVTHPLRRAGERGEGRWERVTWDQATTEIADAMLDAIEESGPRAILRPGTTEGGIQTIALANNIFMRLGATVSDFNAEVGDFSPGLYVTFGRFSSCSSHDDWFHSELVLVWANNPAYSNIPTYHYLTEARYHGAEIVTIAPDYSPSAIHADHYLPVRIGSDAALALALCRVLVDEGLVNEAFVREQTDLGLLVRTDNQRFLRQSDLREGGSDDIFQLFDTRTGQIAAAPRTLDLGKLEPALQGTYRAKLKDGSEIEVVPAFVLMQRRLEAYSPEDASAICGIHAEAIRQLARKIAKKRTRILCGWTTGKSYHGDLMERAMCLVIALTGNWGKKGCGIRGWGAGMFDGVFLLTDKPRTGQQVTAEMFKAQEEAIQAALAADPTLTREILLGDLEGGLKLGASSPFFFWYYQCGYREVYNKRSNGDPSMKRSFDEYVNEALEKGWWTGQHHPTAEEPHRVFFNIGGNPLRMQRGGQRMLLEHLWPKLNMIVTLDFRLSTTALYSDFVLPVAQHHEKTNFCYMVHDVMYLTMGDKAVEPQGESLSEYQVSLRVARKLSERAVARGILEVKTPDGRTVRMDTFYEDLTMNGAWAEDEAILDEAVRDNAVMGLLPPGTTLATLQEKGWMRFTGLGSAPTSLSQATDVRPDETFSPFRYQTEKKEPFPTLTRRAQFYIDHEWFLEAGEQLPMHKDAPALGGDHPFVVTSGHPRSGINGMHSTDRTMMATSRGGKPVAHINDEDAAARGIENGQDICLFNDDASMVIQARVTPSVQPGQVVLYSGFEPYLYKGWDDFANLETGTVKWLNLAGGYGHLRYRPFRWQPVPIDRGIHVDYRKAP